MRYHCLHIKTCFTEDWQADVFAQSLCDLGVDTIDDVSAPDDTSAMACYIPSELWHANCREIEVLCQSTDGVRLLSATECPDENWNAVWESEHPMQELPMGIRIVPHCAFGAGHHETTSMMITGLMSAEMTGKRVLDHGTGTGVLAIFAKRLGAEKVVAVDIDEKSVQNAQENAVLNGETIDVRLGSTPPKEPFDLIVANIHRNILLANMPAYADCLTNGGELWLSGFYEEDCTALQAAAEESGMHLIDRHENGDWRMLMLRKE